MTTTPISRHLALSLAGLAAGLGAANWDAQPDAAASRAVAIVFLPARLTLAHLAKRRQRARGEVAGADRAREAIDRGVMFAGLIPAFSLGVKLAEAAGPGADPDLSRRATMVPAGLFLAVSGNAMPKTLAPLTVPCDGSRTQAFQRLAGWTFVLVGGMIVAVRLVQLRRFRKEA